ncbi:MAG: hypothetical protein LBI20_01500 [Holosporales bacterium]|jgi:hypothetical protein|nr:hypothetical protein [Holosporales bacterium]
MRHIPKWLQISIAITCFNQVAAFGSTIYLASERPIPDNAIEISNTSLGQTARWLPYPAHPTDGVQPIMKMITDLFQGENRMEDWIRAVKSAINSQYANTPALEELWQYVASVHYNKVRSIANLWKNRGSSEDHLHSKLVPARTILALVPTEAPQKDHPLRILEILTQVTGGSWSSIHRANQIYMGDLIRPGQPEIQGVEGLIPSQVTSELVLSGTAFPELDPSDHAEIEEMATSAGYGDDYGSISEMISSILSKISWRVMGTTQEWEEILEAFNAIRQIEVLPIWSPPRYNI